jgi:hypothetical protein
MSERATLDAGSIGITALHLGRGAHNPPLDLAFATLDHARRVQAALRALGKRGAANLADAIAADRVLRDLAHVGAALPAPFDPARWTPRIFSLRFFAGDPTRFVADRRGQVDLTGYAYSARADAAGAPGDLLMNFDYGWYDEDSDSWFHANHAAPGMTIFQSTLAHFSRPLRDFDRQVFCVAFARVG